MPLLIFVAAVFLYVDRTTGLVDLPDVGFTFLLTAVVF
jgi:hypothetical protein